MKIVLCMHVGLYFVDASLCSLCSSSVHFSDVGCSEMQYSQCYPGASYGCKLHTVILNGNINGSLLFDKPYDGKHFLTGLGYLLRPALKLGRSFQSGNTNSELRSIHSIYVNQKQHLYITRYKLLVCQAYCSQSVGGHWLDHVSHDDILVVWKETSHFAIASMYPSASATIEGFVRSTHQIYTALR